MRWYVAETQAGHSREAERRLKDQGFTPFLPEVPAGPKIKVPLFQGYIFVLFDMAADPWRQINGTRGVVKLLPLHLEIPLALPDGYVEELQGEIAAGEFSAADAVDLSLSYVPGDLVAVASGPFQGHEGVLDHYRKGSLVLLMALLGPKTEVTVPAHQIAPPKDAPVTAPTARWLRRSKTRQCGSF